ncbi:MAG: hypothetical protein ACPHK8_04155 [Thermoplasmatota archaeon]
MVAETRTGHFGSGAMIAAGLSVLALIAILAVPFGVLAPEDGDAVTVGYKEADTFEVSNLGDLNLMITGIGLALAGSVILFALNFAKLPVRPLRVFGWTAAILLTTGAFLALITSALWVGGGMADGYVAGEEAPEEPAPEGIYAGGLTGLIQTAVYDPATEGTFWLVSPVIVFLASAVLLYKGLGYNRSLAPKEQRERIGQYNKYALTGAFVIVAAFLVPWSAAEFAVGGGDTDTTYFAAQSILHGAEITTGAGSIWGNLDYVFGTFVLSGMVLLGVAVLSGIMGLANAGSKSNVLMAPALFFGLWNVSAFGASWINGWVPSEAAEAAAEWSPAYFQFAVLLPLGLMMFQMVTHVMTLKQNSNFGNVEPVSFD